MGIHDARDTDVPLRELLAPMPRPSSTEWTYSAMKKTYACPFACSGQYRFACIGLSSSCYRISSSKGYLVRISSSYSL